VFADRAEGGVEWVAGAERSLEVGGKKHDAFGMQDDALFRALDVDRSAASSRFADMRNDGVRLGLGGQLFASGLDLDFLRDDVGLELVEFSGVGLRFFGLILSQLIDGLGLGAEAVEVVLKAAQMVFQMAEFIALRGEFLQLAAALVLQHFAFPGVVLDRFALSPSLFGAGFLLPRFLRAGRRRLLFPGSVSLLPRLL
jgi:hypothetical protein